MAVEVKGLKQKRGDILFTDREWTEAKTRREDYLLVVVGNLEDVPLIRPFGHLLPLRGGEGTARKP